MMSDLYVYYTEDRSGGEICEGDEDSSWPNYEDENIEFEVLEARSVPRQSWIKEVVKIDDNIKSGDEVYIVVVRYYDGGTFGRTCGYFSFQFATKSYEQAEACERALRKGDASTFDCETFMPWFGYFSGLEDVEIWKVVVDKNIAERV